MITEQTECGPMRYMAVAELEHAPWNPRRTEDLAEDNPAMMELVQSITNVGIIHPICVWTDDGRSIVIAGNRRLAAARIAGLASVPVREFANLTEVEARAITRAENEVRFGVSPLNDATLLSEMVELGRCQSEIAAIFGVSEATVCRRAKLVDLIPEVRALQGIESSDTKALEEVASYPQDLQKAAVNRLWGVINGGGRLTLSVVRTTFQALTATIIEDSWMFAGEEGQAALERCKCCARCTGNQPMLFGFDLDSAASAKPGISLGACTDLKCYKRIRAEARQRNLQRDVNAKSGGKGADGIIEVKYSWQDPFSSLKSLKRTAKATFAYVVECNDGERFMVKWGPDPKIAQAERARVEEERQAAQRAQDEALETRRPFLDSAEAKIAEFFKTSDEYDAKEDDHRERLRELFSQIGKTELVELLVDEFAEDGRRFGEGWDGNAHWRVWALRFSELKKMLSKDEISALQWQADRL